MPQQVNHRIRPLPAAALYVAASALVAGCEPLPDGDGGVTAATDVDAADLTEARPAARAALEPTQGRDASGTVEFFSENDGTVTIVAMLENLEPGQHGFHLHQTGDCSAPDASSAEGHFTPENDPHGSPNDAADAYHAGDLGNVVADDAGVAEASIENAKLEIDGEFGVVGRAVIVHENRDDLESQPAGSAGPRVACGVIRETGAGAGSSGGADTDTAAPP